MLSTSVAGLPDSTRELGAPVTVEARCDYGPQSASFGSEPIRLWDFVLATNPPGAGTDRDRGAASESAGATTLLRRAKGGYGSAVYAR